MSDDFEAQNDELLAISCIYDDGFSQEHEDCMSGTLGGELRLFLQLPKPFTLSRKCKNSAVNEALSVEYLPPVVINFYFPPTYPSLKKPMFTLSSKWLSKYQLSQLCKELDRLWEENIGSVVMFTWAQFLTEETMSFLNIVDLLELPNCSNNLGIGSKSETNSASCDQQRRDLSIEAHSETHNAFISDKKTDHRSRVYENQNEISNGCSSETLDERGIQNFSPECNLFSYLREYNEEQKIKRFNLTKYECLICFNEKSGLYCMEFYPCCHVFCKSCCKKFFEVQIQEGNIQLLKCPTDNCNSDASPKQVESLVSSELYKKWDEMMLTSALSSLDDIQLCPRMHCQYPVTIEEQIGRCPSCSFVFCSLCRFGYHALEKCRFMKEDVENIVDKFQNGNAKERQLLIRKYGKQRVLFLVQEFMSANFISETFQKCPKCKTSIEKIDGCNKMSCNRCNTNFCWLCSEVIACLDPYAHFNRKGNPCYNRLFEGVEDIIEPDDDDDYYYE